MKHILYNTTSHDQRFKINHVTSALSGACLLTRLDKNCSAITLSDTVCFFFKQIFKFDFKGKCQISQ